MNCGAVRSVNSRRQSSNAHSMASVARASFDPKWLYRAPCVRPEARATSTMLVWSSPRLLICVEAACKIASRLSDALDLETFIDSHPLRLDCNPYDCY